MEDESWVHNQCLIGHRSERKKRGILNVEDTSDHYSQKRAKIRDLESVFRSEAQAERGGSSALDLNVDVSSKNAVVSGQFNGPLATGKAKVENSEKAKGLDLDLNIEDASNSTNDPFYPYKNYGTSKPTDDLMECGKESMRVWKGLKQNKYLSAGCGHEALPAPVPKPRGRKKMHNDAMKRKIELAKKEQVDRFARVAAPSGLLNGLNPGIINHVRNSKQVHSIIEALVRSERAENQPSGSKKRSHINNGVQEPNERKEWENVHGLGGDTAGIGHEDAISGRQQMGDYPFFSKLVYSNESVRGDPDMHKGEGKPLLRMPSQCNKGCGDDKLTLKLSSSITAASNDIDYLSNDESSDLGSVTSLSVKAANVASQWLELLSQDVRGRLAALRRSKKRVRAVITTELPLLISKEFSSNLEKDSHRDHTNAHAHSVRWSTLFTQMDKAFSEEESHLESWLNQVKEMQLHCEKGLYTSSLCHSSQQTGPNVSERGLRATTDDSAKDLAVKAAAASIYSTCNFLLSAENLPCC